MRSVYLVSYDIADPRRLHKVHHATRDFGRRLQYSVYECRLSAYDLARLQTHLADVIDHARDQVLFVNLGPEDGEAVDRISSLGRPYTQVEHRAIVL